MALSSQPQNAKPNYAELVRFLVQPFLESQESLSVDCELLNNNQRVWIRLAFEGADKGRVFGRGGRNIQAMRKVLDTAATIAGQSVYLDIYKSQSEIASEQESDSGREPSRRTPPPRRPDQPKLSLRVRSQDG